MNWKRRDLLKLASVAPVIPLSGFLPKEPLGGSLDLTQKAEILFDKIVEELGIPLQNGDKESVLRDVEGIKRGILQKYEADFTGVPEEERDITVADVERYILSKLEEYLRLEHAIRTDSITTRPASVVPAPMLKKKVLRLP